MVPFVAAVTSVSFFDFVGGVTFLMRTFIGFAGCWIVGGSWISGEGWTRISGGGGGIKVCTGGGSGSRGIE